MMDMTDTLGHVSEPRQYPRNVPGRMISGKKRPAHPFSAGTMSVRQIMVGAMDSARAYSLEGQSTKSIKSIVLENLVQYLKNKIVPESETDSGSMKRDTKPSIEDRWEVWFLFKTTRDGSGHSSRIGSRSLLDRGKI